MLKILQVRLQQYVNQELPDVKLGFEEAEETDKTANIHWIKEKAGSSRKTYFCFIEYTKVFNYVDHKTSLETT